ncbi:potassium channel family protein [Mycoplasmopsis pulmonis]|uniref:potassium channel family protein n=1 Tax=Mycoplasmopsis pulmonis TaxID=2107 RepID=UPI0010051F70|nr:TrkA family potassium uptake protein [Mycoplasmopsis pulmonis]MDZ7293106.1 TrkA family potassium uptake protein [Mycoplasmopsis pulmonis]VEU67901.1 potassium uptake protein KTRA [Mycoplasmopsis pulmonis]
MIKLRKDICIIGIGRFGSAISKQLLKMRKNIMLIDINPSRLKPFEDEISSLYVADATDINALKNLGIQDVETVIVSANNNIEIVASLLELNVQYIIARASSKNHSRVLKQIGVNVIINPEEEIGTKTALIAGNDKFIRFSEKLQELEDDFVIGSTKLFNTKIEGRTLKSLNLSKKGINVLLIKRGTIVEVPTGNTVLKRNDIITIIGKTHLVTAVFEILNRQRKETTKTSIHTTEQQ